MKSKVLVFALLALLVLSAPILASEKEFAKGNKFITPQLGLNSWTVPFGASFEYAVTENIGVGGTGMLWLWSDSYAKSSVISLSADVAYHFTKVKAEKFDLYGGGYLGYAIYSYSWKDEEMSDYDLGASALMIGPFVGARYYFNPKIAVSLRLDGSLAGHWASFGGSIGVTFKLD
jgi:hypothetical protein